MRLLRRIIFLCALVLPLTLLIPVVSNMSNRTFSVFPFSIYGSNVIDAITDAQWKGTSVIEDFSYDSEKIFIRYILKNSPDRLYPTVFIIIWFDAEQPYIDLSAYDTITFRIREATPQIATLFIKTYEEGISTLGHYQAATLRHNVKVLPLSPSIKNYKIDRKEFRTPDWWYQNMNVSKEDVKRESYKKVVSFDIHFIHTSTEPVEEVPHTLVVEQIAFHRKIDITDFVPVFIMGIIYIAFGLGFVFLKRRRKFLLTGYKPLDFTNHREQELSRIKKYIEENYQDPEISTIKIQKELGIASSRIFKLIWEENNLSFKQLINKIRIEEAKRLLKESDLRIIEISFKVGFNDSSYFNKIFKQLTGMSPSDYREKKA